ncbi:MAG: DMT family transporter [Fuscovulum sp.]|jgi:drug/metabolite transporter (DMT)-like permease|nr:DMT family transporter [Fuscovulum sp.]
MLAFSALVAGSFSLGAMAARHVDPGVLSALRFALAAVILGVAARASGGAVAAPMRAAPWRWLVLGGLMAAYFVLMFEGLKTASAVSTAAVFTLTPVMAAGFGWLFLRQITTPRMALALALGAAGALWVIFDADLGALLRLEVGRGEAVYFWGCAAHAAYAALVRRLNRGESPIVSTFLTMSAGAALLAVWSAPAMWATDWAALPGIVWVTLAYVSVAATATTSYLVQFASMRLPAAKVMAYTYLVPSWVILWELALHGGLPPALVGLGVAMTCLALALLLRD